MAQRIATVGGYALRPGVSRNGRLYTREAIAKAVTRAQARIAEGEMSMRRRDDTAPHTPDPVSQRTHHAAEDDSTRIVGRVTSMSLTEDGSARFTADLADTPHARTIASLAEPQRPGDPDSVAPFLRGVSIRGAWLGEVRRVRHDGKVVETGDDLELDGIDYTGRPGVPGAEIDDYIPATGDPRESAGGRTLICESAQEVTVTDTVLDPGLTHTIGEAVAAAVTEKGAPALKSGKPAAAPTKAPAGSYADPGYQDDRAKRYPLDTKDHARAAWSYINQAKNAKNYSAAQLKRIKGRIKSALKKFGVKVTDEGWIVDPVTAVTETAEQAALREYYPGDGPGGGFEIRLTNGPTTVTVCSYLVDPADLEVVGHAAMAGAISAITSLDPDLDADIDVPGADDEDSDNDMESTAESAGALTLNEYRVREHLPPVEAPPEQPITSGSPADGGASGVSDPPAAPDPAADPTSEEEPAMADDTTTPAVEPAAITPPDTPPAAAAPSPAVTLSAEQFQQLLAAATGARELATAGAPAETAPVAAAPAAETAPPAAAVAETQEQMIARLVAEGVKAALPLAVTEHVQSAGVPGRKGLVAKIGETSAAPSSGEGLNSNGLPADWPDKPLHQYTAEERRQYFGPALRQHYLGEREAG